MASGRKTFRCPYISVWNATEQKEIYGTAWGMDTTTDIPVPIDNIEMQKGMPYFISPDEETELTWVGEVPGKVEFEFKILGNARKNYIVLPLNTEIKTAKDLCEAKADDGSNLMNNSDYIIKWDVEEQKKHIPNNADCGKIINRPDRYDFELYPGEVYLITVPKNKTWTQK